MSEKIIVKSLDQTLALAKYLGQQLKAGMILTLEGDLGAGKTTFTKGLAKGLEIKRNVNSPTFTIIKEYEGRLPLYHMDVYRLENGAEEMGLEEYFYGEGVCVIEWASMIADELPKERLDIKIYRTSDTERTIEFLPIGKPYEFISEVLDNVNFRD